MPSDYSPELRIQLMQTGEKSGLWGDITNVNWELVEAAISGAAAITATAPDTILTASNGIADQARAAILVLGGSPGGAFNVFAPPETKTYIVKNATGSPASIYCSTVLGNNVPAGTAYTLPAGRTAFIRSDGVTFFDAIDHLDNPLPADSGGTGNASYAVGDLLYANTTTSLARLADVATGNVLRSGGVNTAPAWGQVNLATDVTGNLPVNNLGGGTGATSTTFWRGDGTWQTPGGGGDVSFTGTAPTASVNQVAVYGATGTSITTGRTYQFRATSAGQAQIQLFEDTDNGTNSVIIQTPAALGADYTLTLPTTDGNANEFLQTNGSGVLTWAPVSGGTGTVTSVASGNGMNFTTITGTGTVTMGTPSAITSSSTNSTTATSHTHAITGAAFLAGTQTFTGKKTFTGGVISAAYNFTATDESIFGSAGTVTISVGGSGVVTADSSPLSFVPNSDASTSLGVAGARWSVVYAATGTINTSDVNTKQDIADLDDAEKRVAVRVKGLIKKFRFRNAVAEKGDAARIHVGVIAQEVEAAFIAEGLDASRYGLFCSDTWWEKEEQEIFPPTEELQTVTKRYYEPTEGAVEKTQLGVRYEELLAFVVAAM